MHLWKRVARWAAPLALAACAEPAPPNGPVAHPSSSLTAARAPGKVAPDVVDGGPPACALTAELVDDLATSISGAAIALGPEVRGCPVLRASTSWNGGRRIVAASTVPVAEPGRLYEDGTLPPSPATGHRVVLAQSNGTGRPLRFAILLTNLETSSGKLSVLRTGAAGPGRDAAELGRKSFARLLASAAGPSIAVPPGATVRLDPVFDDISVGPGEQVEGLWDYAFDRSHRIVICALDASADPIASCPALRLLPRAAQQRGTFPAADRVIEVARADGRPGLVRVPLTEGAEEPGVDATSGVAVPAIDLGVLHIVRLTGPDPAGQNLALLASGHSGALSLVSPRSTGPVDLVPDGGPTLVGSYAPLGAWTVELGYLPWPGSPGPSELVAVTF